MNIGVIGCGNVGLSNAVVFANAADVYLWDIDSIRLRQIENGAASFICDEVELELRKNRESLHICRSFKEVIESVDIVVMALPTNLNSLSGELDTSSLEDAIRAAIEINRKRRIKILVRSTVPIGFTGEMRHKYNYEDIYFMPEFLREGKSFWDVVHPERIVIGGEIKGATEIINTYLEAIKPYGTKDKSVQCVSTYEAEAIKLFSNAYLAMRIAFFNELDIFAESNNMNAKNIIRGVCGDSRIGDYYNCPSFGYGGYCLPKDTNQLSQSLKPDNVLTEAISKSNQHRMDYIVSNIDKTDGDIGIYRLQAKRDSLDIKNSVAIYILQKLVARGRTVFVYEPLAKEIRTIDYDKRVIFVNTVDELNEKSKIIVANRIDTEILPFLSKVYTRDIEYDGEQHL